MKIITRRFGEVEIDPATLITFPNGILGFPNAKEFVLLDPNSKSPLKWLQSITEPTLAFVITDPKLFKDDYVVNVFRKDLEDIQVKDPENVLIWVIVTVPRDPSKMTANLKGPLLLNTENMVAKQMILEDQDYDLKYQLIADEKSAAVS